MLKQVILYSLRFLMMIIIGGSIWLIGLVLFTHLIPTASIDTINPTEGIVVFTGGGSRMRVALTLFEQKKGEFLLISGVNPVSNLAKLVDQMPLKPQITLGYDALDTIGNAAETAAWVEKYNIKTLRLITSNYHMPRSLFELRHLLPHVQIVPHPVVRERFLHHKWWVDASTLKIVVHEYNKYLFSLARRAFKNLQNFAVFQEKV